MDRASVCLSDSSIPSLGCGHRAGLPPDITRTVLVVGSVSIFLFELGARQTDAKTSATDKRRFTTPPLPKDPSPIGRFNESAPPARHDPQRNHQPT